MHSAMSQSQKVKTVCTCCVIEGFLSSDEFMSRSRYLRPTMRPTLALPTPLVIVIREDTHPTLFIPPYSHNPPFSLLSRQFVVL